MSRVGAFVKEMAAVALVGFYDDGVALGAPLLGAGGAE